MRRATKGEDVFFVGQSVYWPLRSRGPIRRFAGRGYRILFPSRLHCWTRRSGLSSAETDRVRAYYLGAAASPAGSAAPGVDHVPEPPQPMTASGAAAALKAAFPSEQPEGVPMHCVTSERDLVTASQVEAATQGKVVAVPGEGQCFREAVALAMNSASPGSTHTAQSVALALADYMGSPAGVNELTQFDCFEGGIYEMGRLDRHINYSEEEVREEAGHHAAAAEAGHQVDGRFWAKLRLGMAASAKAFGRPVYLHQLGRQFGSIFRPEFTSDYTQPLDMLLLQYCRECSSATPAKGGMDKPIFLVYNSTSEVIHPTHDEFNLIDHGDHFGALVPAAYGRALEAARARYRATVESRARPPAPRSAAGFDHDELQLQEAAALARVGLSVTAKKGSPE